MNALCFGGPQDGVRYDAMDFTQDTFFVARMGVQGADGYEEVEVGRYILEVLPGRFAFWRWEGNEAWGKLRCRRDGDPEC